MVHIKQTTRMWAVVDEGFSPESIPVVPNMINRPLIFDNEDEAWNKCFSASETVIPVIVTIETAPEAEKQR